MTWSSQSLRMASWNASCLLVRTAVGCECIGMAWAIVYADVVATAWDMSGALGRLRVIVTRRAHGDEERTDERQGQISASGTDLRRSTRLSVMTVPFV